MKLSIQKKIFLIIFAGAVLTTQIVSLLMFFLDAESVLRDYKRDSAHMMAYAASLVGHDHIKALCDEVETRYAGLSDQALTDILDPEVEETFLPLVTEDFLSWRDILVKGVADGEMRNLFCFTLDEDRERIVYLIDGDEPAWAYLPGQWQETNIAEIQKSIGSDRYLRVSHTPGYGWVGTNYLPVTDENGTVIAYMGADFDVSNFYYRLFRFLAIYEPILVVAILFCAFLQSGYLKKQIIEPVKKLATAAVTYTGMDKIHTVEMPEIFSELQIATGDEIEELYRTMTDMEKNIRFSMSEVRRITAEKEHLEGELAMAANLKAHLMPNVFPAFPEEPAIDIYADQLTAVGVGGDYFDFFRIDEDHIAIVSADIFAGGTAAALYMIIFKLLINSVARMGLPASDTMRILNDHLCTDNEDDLSLAVWYGVLKISTGEVEAVNAGHETPVLLTSQEAAELAQNISNFPVGVVPKMEFCSYSFTLQKEDRLFLYTDGVTEAEDTKGAYFGSDRLMASLSEAQEMASEETVGLVQKRMLDFCEGVPLAQDATMLCLGIHRP